MSTQQNLPYLTVSPDGYVRLTLEELSDVKLTHLISGLDQAGDLHAFSETTATDITGYTEWRSQGTPAVSIGWDWEMTTQAGICQLRMLNHPRSNLMLIKTSSGIDVGQLENSTLLKNFVGQLAWQEAVIEFLAQ